jgi:protein involved in polysaccharide export with SLBB domain
MKKGLTVLFILVGIFCFSHSYGQLGSSLLTASDLSNVKIDDYSDDELRSMYQKATESGMTEAQLLKIAFDKGLPNSEMLKLRSRLESIMPAKKDNTNNNNPSSDDKSKKPQLFDTTNKVLEMESFKPDFSIYGSELFTKNSLVFEPNLRISTPSGYVLGPDDEITVNVYGYSEKSYNLKINEDGNVYIQNVGPVYLNGLTIEQATEKIKNKLSSTIYRNIRSGGTKVQVSLAKIRSIRVTVIGQAKKPGTYTVSSLTTLYNVLYLCGGPTAMGSYRSIELIRGNGAKRLADIYGFLAEGSQKGNVLLQEGDIIRIPYYKNRVSIKGNVKRPGKFEMLEGETFKDLLEYCGGFDDTAYRAAVSVVRITPTEKKIVDLSANQYDNFKINGSDEYEVGRLLNNYENRVIISGSVSRPGYYELSNGMTIRTLIDKAGGLNGDAYTKRISIFRYGKNKLPSILSVNLDSVSNNQILLNTEDSVSIHSIFEFKDDYYVVIEGNVRRQGNIKWRENLSLRDLLLSAGGLTDLGDSASIEISRRIRNAEVSATNHLQTDIFNINLSDENDISRDVILHPYDLIVVKGLSGYTVQRTVVVAGEVKSPGKYALSKSGDRISDIFKRVGGFKASADSNSVTIRRNTKSNLLMTEREKLFERILNVNPDSLATNDRLKSELNKSYDLVSVNLREALSNPNSSDNLILEDGDVLTIDKNTNLVKISGEIFYPTLLPYKPNASLKRYIREAGNFTSSARRSGVMVIYPDGKAKSIKKFLFIRKYPVVTPRSEIFVPQRLKNNRTKISVSELAVLVSTLGIIAQVIISSQK